MFGYACDETDDLMPMPIWLAHRLAERLAAGPQGRRRRLPAPRRQDAGVGRVRRRRARVRLDTVLISTQHGPGVDIDGDIKPDAHRARDPAVAARRSSPTTTSRCFVNPTGQLRARRSARRLRAHRPQDHRRHLRRHGPPRRRRVLGQGPDQGRPLGRVRGAPDRRRPSSRPGSPSGAKRRSRTRSVSRTRCRSWSTRSARRRSTRRSSRRSCASVFDMRPAAIIERLDLRRPIFRRTAAYGHFGRTEATASPGRHDRRPYADRAAPGRRARLARAPGASAGRQRDPRSAGVASRRHRGRRAPSTTSVPTRSRPSVARRHDRARPAARAARARLGRRRRRRARGRRDVSCRCSRSCRPGRRPTSSSSPSGSRGAGPGRRVAVLRAASPPNGVAPAPPAEVDVAVYRAATDGPLALARRFGCARSAGRPPRTGGSSSRRCARAEGSTIVVRAPTPARAARARAAIWPGGARDRRVLHSGRARRASAPRRGGARRGRAASWSAAGPRRSRRCPISRRVVVVDDADEALQEERVADVARARRAVERAARAGAPWSPWCRPRRRSRRSQLAASLVPVAPPADVEARRAGRALDVVDRREEPPGAGLLSEALAAALHRTLDAGGARCACSTGAGRFRLLACRTCRDSRAACAGTRGRRPSGALVCPRCATTRPPVCRVCRADVPGRAPGVAKLRDEVAALVPRADVADVDAATERGPRRRHRSSAPRRCCTGRAAPAPAGARRVPRPRPGAARAAVPRRRAGALAARRAARSCSSGRPTRRAGLLVQTRAPDHEVVRGGRRRATRPIVLDGRGRAPAGARVPAVRRARRALRRRRRRSSTASAALRTAVVDGLQVLGPRPTGARSCARRRRTRSPTRSPRSTSRRPARRAGCASPSIRRGSEALI